MQRQFSTGGCQCGGSDSVRQRRGVCYSDGVIMGDRGLRWSMEVFLKYIASGVVLTAFVRRRQTLWVVAYGASD